MEGTDGLWAVLPTWGTLMSSIRQGTVAPLLDFMESRF